jgi:hypothetical protein
VDSGFRLSLITYIGQSYPKLRGSFFSVSAGGFWGRVDTRTFVILKGLGRRYSLPGIESDEDKG